MRWFFLSREKFIKILLSTLIIFNFLPLWISFLWTIFLILLFFSLRKNKAFYKDNLSINQDLILSPVNGEVLSVKKQSDDEKKGPIVRIAMPLLGPNGLFLPFDCSIESVKVKGGKKLWRHAAISEFTNEFNRYNLVLRGKSGDSIGLDLIKCPLGLAPRLYVEGGDKGKSLACFGYIPLGASVNINIPVSGKVLVSAGDKLKAGETAIVGL